MRAIYVKQDPTPRVKNPTRRERTKAWGLQLKRKWESQDRLKLTQN